MSHSVNKISINNFVAVIKSSEKLFVVDVRTEAEVDNEYFEGTLNIPLQELNSLVLGVALHNVDWPAFKPIYFLCGSGQRAKTAAEMCAQKISNPIVVIEGGINAMRRAGITLKKGAGSIISLERQVRIIIGLLVLVGVITGMTITPTLYALSALMGLGLLFSGITDFCGMALIVARMPWNRAR